MVNCSGKERLSLMLRMLELDMRRKRGKCSFTAEAPIHSLKLITSLLIQNHIFSQISGSQHQRQRRTFPVNILHQEDAQVGVNNFNWPSLSSVKLIKLPRESLKTKTDSGEKLRLSKYTQVGASQKYNSFQLDL